MLQADGQTKYPPDATWVTPNDPRIQYYGRCGTDEPGSVGFFYSASGFRARFSGRSLALRLEEDNFGPANSMGIRIDGGAEIPLRLHAATDHTYVIAIGLPNKVHDLEVYRRQDTYGGVAKFKGMWLEKGAILKRPATRSKKRIEFFGDSVTSGAATTPFGYEAKPDSAVEYDNVDEVINNGYWGLGSVTSRILKADANIQGIGGLSLLDQTGWFGGELEHTVGLESTYDKLNPIPGQMSSWDFTRFTPHVVVVAIGQNDARGGDIHDQAWRTKWKDAYKGLLENLRGHYPKANFVLSTTVLIHDLEWDKAIHEVADEFCLEYSTKSVHFFSFKRAGIGTPGHPRLKEQEEMGQELAAFINRVPGVWK